MEYGFQRILNKLGAKQVVSSKYCFADGVDEIEDKGPNFK